MKLTILALALLSSVICKAAAGSSQDETLAYAIAIGILLLIYFLLKIPTLISKTRQFFQKRKELSLSKKQELPKNESSTDLLISSY